MVEKGQKGRDSTAIRSRGVPITPHRVEGGVELSR